MSVDFATCDLCGDNFCTGAPHQYCEREHIICHNCAVSPALDREAFDFDLHAINCPVCRMGGNERERLRNAEAALKDALAHNVWWFNKGWGEAQRTAMERLTEEQITSDSPERSKVLGEAVEIIGRMMQAETPAIKQPEDPQAREGRR